MVKTAVVGVVGCESRTTPIMVSPQDGSPFFLVPAAAGAGVVASVAGVATDNGNFGAAGFMMSLAAVLGAGFQYYKATLDAKQRDRQIAELQAQLRQTQSDLIGARQRHHGEANRLQGIILELQVKIGNLEGRLGVLDKTHVQAIDINADNIGIVADKTGVVLPVKPPHLEPIADDDESQFDVYGKRLIHEPPSEL